jgi:putative tryptophan/tyrosine transport system substrate-binding protein
MTARRRSDILAPRLVRMTAAGPLPAVSLRSGTVGRATSRSSITWCDPGRAVVYVSLARPGGNVTGLSAQVTDIYAKRVEVLKELIPRAVRLAALFNMSNPAIPTGVERSRDVGAIPTDPPPASRRTKA